MANTAVFGIYASRPQVEEAVEQLRNAGFRPTDLSLLLPENLGTKDLGHEKHTKAPEGAVTGGTTGAVIGGVLGWLAGIGAIAIPGIGPFIAAGPIVAALSGIGAGAAVGGVTGALVGLGIPEYEAKRYAGMVKEGKILLSVHADDRDWVSRAKQILERTGGEQISSTGESSGDYANAERPGTRRETF